MSGFPLPVTCGDAIAFAAGHFPQPEQQEPPVPLLSPGFGAAVFCISLPQHEGAF